MLFLVSFTLLLATIRQIVILQSDFCMISGLWGLVNCFLFSSDHVSKVVILTILKVTKNSIFDFNVKSMFKLIYYQIEYLSL